MAEEHGRDLLNPDQGFYALGEHGWYDKRWMFEEESLRMPFLIRWPGVIEGGGGCVQSEALIQNIDYAPTFLEMAGVPIPEAIREQPGAGPDQRGVCGTDGLARCDLLRVLRERGGSQRSGS